MLKIALTGGIGSGKSTVSRFFSELDIAVIDADQISHQLTRPNSPAFGVIVEHFGQSIVLANKQLDRKRLRDIVFSDANEKKWLENLLHPMIREEITLQLSQVRSAYALIVIPLLAESDSYKFIDRICVIDTQTDMQLQRATQRDHSSNSDIRRIMQAQSTRNQRLAIADDIIINDGNLDTLKQRVLQLNQFYLELTEIN